eukprot:TRINITY_DN18625_c0_g1_i1.p1 TRINITY_DN18625_c0_g1~~TRINITY_DN18625_c0_g1_i1.p1  ORF type:complete len:289 (+),score=74.41 TRINITY_DN18625_c0_g1_i1:77-943(+)
MPYHLPRPAFLLAALLCNAALHWALSSWLASPADVATGAAAHFAVGLSIFLFVGLGQHNPYGRYSGAGVLGMGGLTACSQLCWIMQELPAFCAAFWALLRSGRTPGPADPGALLLALFCAHYFQRTFVFPLLMRGRRPTAFYVYLSAAAYCGFNGHLMALALLSQDWGPGRSAEASFVAGVILFAAGMWINIDADQHLRSLRADPADTSYHIPRRGLFRWVSGANFLGEVIEWSGFALAARNAAACAFLATVAGNLAPRAVSHHQWYLDRFGAAYAALNRKALIPFLL